MRNHSCFAFSVACRSPCGERGLKLLASTVSILETGRSPCGERGLKSQRHRLDETAIGSLPVRGAWIEMIFGGSGPSISSGRSPCGERGLKYPIDYQKRLTCDSRSPCGERGLKSELLPQLHSPYMRRSPCGERGLK